MILSAALKRFIFISYGYGICLAQIKKQRYGAPLSFISVPELHRCRLKREFTTLLTNHVDGASIRALAQHTNHPACHSVAASPWFLTFQRTRCCFCHTFLWKFETRLLHCSIFCFVDLLWHRLCYWCDREDRFVVMVFCYKTQHRSVPDYYFIAFAIAARQLQYKNYKIFYMMYCFLSSVLIFSCVL